MQLIYASLFSHIVTYINTQVSAHRNLWSHFLGKVPMGCVYKGDLFINFFTLFLLLLLFVIDFCLFFIFFCLLIFHLVCYYVFIYLLICIFIYIFVRVVLLNWNSLTQKVTGGLCEVSSVAKIFPPRMPYSFVKVKCSFFPCTLQVLSLTSPKVNLMLCLH